MDQKRKVQLIRLAQITLAVILITDLVVHYKAAHQAPALPPATVIVEKPKRQNMVEYITQTGNTVAFNSVDLVARVEGYLQGILFTDGTFVKKGHDLFAIEPETYMAKLREAKATVEAQKAADAYAKSEYARQKRMFKENATSLNNVEKWLANSHESEANVTKAEANAEIAAINYSYTHVQAPFDGRIGRHLVDKGNLVGNGVATHLATIEQLDPIYVYFNLNEIDLINLRKAAHAQDYDAKRLKEIPVYASLQNETGFKYEGKLDFVNTGLDSSTGTMEFRALLPNKERALVPGLFVQVRVAISKPTPQLTVPNTAILYDQIGPYLLTANAANEVVLKRVTLGSLELGRQAILTGITENDRIIVSGLQHATPGNHVTPQPEKNAS